MSKIVVIEDDVDLFTLLRYNLEKEGFQTSGLTTGRGAAEFCRREKPDLILLDIMLPDVSGLEICKRLRRDEETAELPIIFVTARGSEGDRFMGLEFGANDYIVKPFYIRDVIARVKMQLAARQKVQNN